MVTMGRLDGDGHGGRVIWWGLLLVGRMVAVMVESYSRMVGIVVGRLDGGCYVMVR